MLEFCFVFAYNLGFPFRPSLSLLILPPSPFSISILSWQTGEWGECSVPCGAGGYQLREVYCAEPRNTSMVRVADHNCAPPRPQHRRSCNPHKCPRWYDGIWSQVREGRIKVILLQVR